MIHFHLSEDDLRLVSEGLGRLRRNCDVCLAEPHMTKAGLDMLKQHRARIDALALRVELRLRQPPRPLAKAPRKRGNPRKPKLVVVAVEQGFPG